ncbi:hypothetical protein Chor_005879 [Crotalus horridus]
MAAGAVDSRGEAKVLGAELEESDTGSEWSSGVPEDSFSSDDGEQGDEVDDTPKTPDAPKDAAESKEAGNAGWAEAMAKVLNKKEKLKSKEAPAWSILRDDYMMGASMKDWDKESEEENNAGEVGSVKQESGSDSDQ